MKIWAKTEEYSEGKYLVVRRDGTVPEWPHFVLGGYDPCAAIALHAYAAEARSRGWDEEYVGSIEALACEFEALANVEREKKSDPYAGPHRKDLTEVIFMMQRKFDVAFLVDLTRGPSGIPMQIIDDGKTAADCDTKFKNTENFKGFPTDPPMVQKKGGRTAKKDTQV